jgi:TfoX/Sxy family transcriptional regulator of competence genes
MSLFPVQREFHGPGDPVDSPWRYGIDQTGEWSANMPSKRSNPSSRHSAELELAALANLGTKSARAVVAAGITSMADLRRLGSVAAYARVKNREPAVTLNLLWALEGAISSLPWQTVAREHRTSLLLALEQHERGGIRPAGYSSTPLPKKLGLKADTRLVVLDGPQDYATLLGPLPAGLEQQRAVTRTTNLVHLFVTKRRDLVRHLGTLRTKLAPEAAIWVSWPKKSSKVPTEVTEDTIREVALPLGFVDVKVCAVSEVWSGLKLSVRKELRAKRPT